MQPNYVDFLRRFKPVNTSSEKRPVGQPRKKPVDQPFTTDCTRLTIARAIATSDLDHLSQAWPDPRIKGGSGKLRIPNSGCIIWLRVGLVGGAQAWIQYNLHKN